MMIPRIPPKSRGGVTKTDLTHALLALMKNKVLTTFGF